MRQYDGTASNELGHPASIQISETLAVQRIYFESGRTRSLDFRSDQLLRLKKALLDSEPILREALAEDLHKSETETYLTEILLTVNEINFLRKNLHRWARPERVRTDLIQQPASSYRIAEPLGVVLVISPWNYPVQLSLMPLAGALAAGNCAVLKPSELAPRTSAAITRLIADTFPPDYVAAIEGGPEVAQALLRERLDYVFFTGGTRIGREVMRAAAEHLTPVTLELGSKSPCVVDHTADLTLAARRIAFGRFLNAGQTCVSPDYVLVERSVSERFVGELTEQLRSWWGEAETTPKDFSHIVDERHFDRLTGLIHAAEREGAQVVYGGTARRQERYLAPTVVTGVSPTSALMEEEIFGPILPILEYGSIHEAYEQILSRPKPLAAYLFSRNRSLQRSFVAKIPSGGTCLNDTLSQMTTESLPFGGVGASGTGSYHGKESFRTFSHYKSVMKKATWFDLPVRYPPYERRKGMVRLLRRLFS